MGAAIAGVTALTPALSYNQISATHLKIGHPQIKSTGEWSSNELQWFDLCNSFKDRAPVDEIYACPIFKWVAVTWLKRYFLSKVNI